MEFILENENLRVTVESHGAELVSVVNKQTGAEMLWQADPAVWARHAPVLFPYCGRLKDGAFTCKGVRYEGCLLYTSIKSNWRSAVRAM